MAGDQVRSPPDQPDPHCALPFGNGVDFFRRARSGSTERLSFPDHCESAVYFVCCAGILLLYFLLREDRASGPRH